MLTEFVDAYSPRESGTDDARRTAEYLQAQMQALGYDAEMQPVEAEFIKRQPFVTIVEPPEGALRSWYLSFTGLGEVSAQVAHAGKALDGDALDGVADKIALIERGEIPFGDKVQNVADAGALAAVIYNNVHGRFFGTLRAQADIPAVSISRQDGLNILNHIEDGTPVEATVRVVKERLPSQNVVAAKPSQGDRIVVLGAHYDGVADTQGANDNGTGIVSLLLLAEELAAQDLPFDVRFVFFGVEEVGLFGSKHYVESLSETERSKHVAMLNFDAMGDGKASMTGSASLLDAAAAYAEAHGLDALRHPGFDYASSDHAPFIDAGIPAVFFFGDDFSRINSPRDTLEFVDPAIMGTHMALGLGLLQHLAGAQ